MYYEVELLGSLVFGREPMASHGTVLSIASGEYYFEDLASDILM